MYLSAPVYQPDCSSKPQRIPILFLLLVMESISISIENNNVPRLCHATSHSRSQDCLATWQPLSIGTGTISWLLYCLQREASVSATQWIQSLERLQLGLALVFGLFVWSTCSKPAAQLLRSGEFGHQHTCPRRLSGTTFRNVSALCTSSGFGHKES